MQSYSLWEHRTSIQRNICPMLGGIPTETYCYKCANAYNQIQLAMAELLEKVGQ